jgi:hypothetical protein
MQVQLFYYGIVVEVLQVDCKITKIGHVLSTNVGSMIPSHGNKYKIHINPLYVVIRI